MSSINLDPRVEEELTAVAERCGCELLSARFRGGVLQLVLDREEGVDVEDCVRVSRDASALLDVLDFGPEKYTLEVTSPGLDREFFRDSDYERFQGRNVRVTWKSEDKQHKRTVVGLLEASRLQNGNKEIEIRSEGEKLVIPLADILVTRLEPEF